MYLENAVRFYTLNVHSVHVITGPLYEDDEEQLEMPGADEPVRVPTGYWKVVTHPNQGRTAFIFDQDTSRNTSYCAGITTVEEIERRTGYDLFPLAPTTTKLTHLDQLGCWDNGRENDGNDGNYQSRNWSRENSRG